MANRVEKNKKSEGYRHLPIFRHGREPHWLWRFLKVLFTVYCDQRPYFHCGLSWRIAWRRAMDYFRQRKREQPAEAVQEQGEMRGNAEAPLALTLPTEALCCCPACIRRRGLEVLVQQPEAFCG